MTRLADAFDTLPRFRRIEVLMKMGLLPRWAMDRLPQDVERSAVHAAMTSSGRRAVLERAVACYERLMLSKGDVFEYDASDPHGFSAAWRLVTITWVDDVDVHYRREGETKIRQTPINRFVDVIRPCGVSSKT